MEEMTMNGYQRCALETAVYPMEYKTVYPALGMNGEAGEVADKVKKIIRDEKLVKDGGGSLVLGEEQRRELAKEVGDVLWYVAVLAYDLGYNLDEIAKMNYEKLISRQQRGQLGGSGDNR